MWFLAALFSGAMYTISGLLTRHVLKGNKDAWAFSFYFSAIGALVSLPFALANWQSPADLSSQPFPWLVMLLIGIVVVAHNYLNFKSANFLPASIAGTITKFRLVWVFILGLIFALEPFNYIKLLGILLTTSAGLVLLFKKEKVAEPKGIAFAISATIIYAIAITTYQYLFKFFNSATLTFIIFMIPTIVNPILMPNRLERITSMYKTYKTPLLIACLCGGLANLAINYALSQGNSTVSLVVVEAFLIITLIAEQIFQKEQGSLLKKIVATILAVAGAVLMRIA